MISKADAPFISSEMPDLDHQVLDALADMVLVKGAGSKIVWANKAFRDFYGMTNAELRGIIDAPFNEPDFTQKYVRDDALVFETGEVLDLEEQVKRHDGQLFVVHTKKSPIRDGTGKIAMTVGVFRDITESKQVKQRLNTATRMASVGTLAAGVAHEINNPLMYATGNVEHMSAMLSEARPSDSSLQECRVLLEQVKDGLERVRLIVHGLQTFSREGEGRRQHVEIRHVVEWAAKLANNEIRHRARLEVDCGSAIAVDADEAQLGQVVLNLLVNAAQAIPEGNSENNVIRVVGRITDSGVVSVEVRDTGSGIAPEHLPHLFDPFFTTKAVGEGTGLGLSIAHNIILAHHGSIEVESTPLGGSTFRILLPPAVPVPKEVLPSLHPIGRGRRGRVMVVDDERTILAIVKRILGTDHEVLAFSDAALALDAISQGERFDIVLCDLMMPAMSGMDFFEAVSRIAPGEERRITFMTGGAFSPRARAFVEVVANSVLSKPIRRTTLLEVCRAACLSNDAMSQAG